MKNYCFGADIGGTTVKLGLFESSGVLLDKWEIPTRREAEGEFILPDIAEAISGKCRERQLRREDIAGIGLGIPGPVTADDLVLYAPNLGWERKEVSKEFSDLTGLFCKAGNDANVAALGETWCGAARGYRDVLLLTLGTGVGGGIITDGKILTGAHGSASEIGHLHVNDDIDEKCCCGNRGCLEQFASATGIVRLARNLLRDTDEPSVLREGELTAETVFDAVKAGDPLASRAAEEFGRYLGLGISMITAVVDPEIILLGGGVSKAGRVVIDYSQKYYREYAARTVKDTPFALTELGNDAGIYGCAKLIIG